jgi:hypothetical protein
MIQYKWHVLARPATCLAFLVCISYQLVLEHPRARLNDDQGFTVGGYSLLNSYRLWHG